MLVSEPFISETVGLQAMRLIAGVSSHGKRHLDEVETDLLQIDTLLDEAIKKLSASFLAMHEALGKQQETLDALLAGRVSAAECAPALAGIQSEIGQHINATITGLQFQDMTSQLIGGTGKHLGELRGLFGALAAADMPPGADGIPALLDSMDRKLAELESGVAGCLQKPVAQRHMESGDIELF